MHKRGKREFMQPHDIEISKAKATILPFFIDSYGRPKKTPYYITQLQTLVEGTHFPWIVYQAINQLVEQGVLLKFQTETKYHERVVFVFNSKIETSASKSKLESHMNSICRL
ncbi:MAG: hypothetical protein ACE14S_06830 [Candidatus Bathyarchaeia archaeon]